METGHLRWLSVDPTSGRIGYPVNINTDSLGALYPWRISAGIDYDLILLPTAYNSRWLVGRVVVGDLGAVDPDQLWPNGPQYFCAERVSG